MSAVREQTTRARNRLWLNLWFDVGCRLLTWLAAAFALLVLLSRLQGWAVPWLAAAGVTAAVVVIVSIIWSWRVRPSAALAAAALDEAAGLRERVSSSLLREFGRSLRPRRPRRRGDAGRVADRRSSPALPSAPLGCAGGRSAGAGRADVPGARRASTAGGGRGHRPRRDAFDRD